MGLTMVACTTTHELHNKLLKAALPIWGLSERHNTGSLSYSSLGQPPVTAPLRPTPPWQEPALPQSMTFWTER